MSGCQMKNNNSNKKIVGLLLANITYKHFDLVGFVIRWLCYTDHLWFHRNLNNEMGNVAALHRK